MLAAQYGHGRIVKLCLRKVCVCVSGGGWVGGFSGGEVVFHHVPWQPHMLSLLHTTNRKNTNSKDNNGKHQKHPQGASLTLTNAQGNTAAAVAKMAGHRSVYKFLQSAAGESEKERGGGTSLPAQSAAATAETAAAAAGERGKGGKQEGEEAGLVGLAGVQALVLG